MNLKTESMIIMPTQTDADARHGRAHGRARAKGGRYAAWRGGGIVVVTVVVIFGAVIGERAIATATDGAATAV